MRESLEVRLPVPDILIVEPVDHVLAEDVVGLVGIGLISQEIGRDEVRMMNRGAFVAATDRGEDLVAQPCQVRSQMAENERRGEVPRERLMSMQEVLWALAHDQIDRIEESLKIALLGE